MQAKYHYQQLKKKSPILIAIDMPTAIGLMLDGLLYPLVFLVMSKESPRNPAPSHNQNKNIRKNLWLLKPTQLLIQGQ